MNGTLFFGLCLIGFIGTIMVVVRVVVGGGATKRFLWVAPSVGLFAFVAYSVGRINVSNGWLALTVVLGGLMAASSFFFAYRTLLVGVKKEVVQLSERGRELELTVQELVSTTAIQSESTNQLTVTVNEMDHMTDSTSKAAREVLQAADEAFQLGVQGATASDEAVDVMVRIAEASSFMQMIADISDQSNLLALNASIEAAKAGEQGRGFAVVADEVRNLANQSKEAALQVRRALEMTQKGKDSIEKVAQNFQSMAKVNGTTAERARHISGVTVQQAAGSKQIAQAMEVLALSGRETAASAETLSQSVVEFSKIGNRLHQLTVG